MKMDRINPGSGPKARPAAEDQDIAVWMEPRAEEIAGFFKALSHEGRLMILCYLASGEKSVTELEALLGHRPGIDVAEDEAREDEEEIDAQIALGDQAVAIQAQRQVIAKMIDEHPERRADP